MGRLGGEQAQEILHQLSSDPVEQVAREAKENL
jgi:hypothetical protein